MTARPLMMVLAGSVMLVPLALAQEHAVSRGGGGGGSVQAYSRDSGSGGNSAFRAEPTPVAMASDHAVSRGGGGGDSSPSHSSGGSSSGGSSSGYQGGPSSSGGSSAEARHPSSSGASHNSGSRTPSSIAERRHPRAGTGTGGHGGGYYPDYPYYPGWGWGSYWWPYGSYYDGWYGGGYWGYPYGGWGANYSYAHHDVGSVRILVNPSEARVYVDGYYAGTVDDFDGLFQRLNVAPGRHEISLKLEGHKTHRMKVYVPFEGTLKLHYTMEKGAGETVEDLAVNIPERELERERERERAQSVQLQEGRRDEAPAPATLRLNVKPPDASIYIDGTFRGTAREAASVLLPPGRHKIEIVRPGYRTVEHEVETAVGEPTDLTIELERTSI